MLTVISAVIIRSIMCNAARSHHVQIELKKLVEAAKNEAGTTGSKLEAAQAEIEALKSMTTKLE